MQHLKEPVPIMDNPLLAYPGYLLKRAASSRLSQLARHLEPLGVGVSEASIVTLIDRNPDISQAECGRLLSIQRTNLNPITRRLTDRGIVVSSKGPGRTQHLRLSEAGAALAKQIVVEFEAHEARIYASVPEHLRSELLGLLRGLAVHD
jgi:DNA-binding MarR family transcriptional regulator